MQAAQAFLHDVLDPGSTWDASKLVDEWVRDRASVGDFLAEHALQIGIVVATARCHEFVAQSMSAALADIGDGAVDLRIRAESAIAYMCERSRAYPRWIVLIQKDMDIVQNGDAFRWNCYERFMNDLKRSPPADGCEPAAPAPFVKGRRDCWYPASFDGWNNSRAFRFFCLKLLVRTGGSGSGRDSLVMGDTAAHAFSWALGLMSELDPMERLLLDFARSDKVKMVQKVGMLWNMMGSFPRRDILDLSFVSSDVYDIPQFENWWNRRWRMLQTTSARASTLRPSTSTTLFAHPALPCTSHPSAALSACDFKVVRTVLGAEGILVSRELVCPRWAERVMLADWLRVSVFGMRPWGVRYAPEGYLVIPMAPTDLQDLKLINRPSDVDAHHAGAMLLPRLLHASLPVTSIFLATFTGGRQAIVDLPAASELSAVVLRECDWAPGAPSACVLARMDCCPRSSVPCAHVAELSRVADALKRAGAAGAAGTWPETDTSLVAEGRAR